MAQEAPFGLIFEDDVDLADDFPELLSDLINHSDDWDLLLLRATHPGPLLKSFSLGKYTVFKFTARAASAAAYIVTKSSAQKIIDKTLPAVQPYDWVFNKGHLLKARVRLVRPEPLKMRQIASTIEVPGLRKKRGRFLKRHVDSPILPRAHLPITRFWDGIRRVVHLILGG